MTAVMEFCLLGPLVVRRDGAVVPVTARRQRAVLAALLLDAGRVVGPDELAEVLWGSEPPRLARVTVQNYVMRLRNALGEAGRTRIRTVAGGYAITATPSELDVCRFEALLEDAAAAARRQSWDVAVDRADQALSLWRGEPLADAGSEVLALRRAPQLTELHVTALETRLEARLHLGRAAGVVGELRRLAAEHPMRERAHGLLMMALCREGRQAEALEAYQQARRLLVDELGTEPGAALRELHHRILVGDPALAGEPARAFGGRRPDAMTIQAGALAAARRAGGRGDARMRPAVDVFPVAIGHYADADLADLDVEAQLGQLVDVLAPFGGRHRPWRHPARERGADAVQRRLREWSGQATANQPARSSVLYWAGHGWSDGTRSALAHAESPAVVGVSGLEPQQLAEAIRARQGGVEPLEQAADSGRWAMVIVEACHATQIADAVMAALHGPDAPGRLLVVAVPDDDVGPTGRFAGVLANLLAGTFLTERRIMLRDLAAQLERVLGPRNVHQRALGEAAMVRVHPPTDTARHLEDVLEELSPDERGHFVVKASCAEHGELSALSWFFEGRENELAQISAWLDQASSGMFVLTGRAGSGKSALLGTVLVRSLSALREALTRRGLIPAAGPGTWAPAEPVFDAVVHLSGLDLAQAVTRIAAAAGIGPLPSRPDSDAGVAADLDFLAAKLAGLAGSFTVLADALDESLDPLDIARSLLARIAAVPGVRILVGTRASTSEAPDTPGDDENLLDALGTGTVNARVIWVGQDREAIRQYVTARLRAARDFGVGGRTIAHMREVSDQDIRRVADEVASGAQEFLFARLAVYELIADPRLLTRGMAHSLGQLLRGTHRDLFGRALGRLAGYDDRYPVLMLALSLARGRGLPEADGSWTIIAGALAPRPLSRLVAADWASAIGGLLSHAAAYITADTSTGCDGSAGPGTVYRLAHRTFVEYFAEPALPGQRGNARRLAASALLRAADGAAAGPGRVPGYLTHHLSGHIAEAGMWDDLACLAHVLDRIDPNAVTTDAIRTLFGCRAVPPPIAGIIGARDTLAAASPADRPGLRQLATAIHSHQQVLGEPVTGWGVAAAQAGRSTLHVKLAGHTSTVNKVLSLTLSGRVVLASCGDDGTLRLWDPVAATPVGVPMRGHASTVDDICVLRAHGGRTLLASVGEDGTVRLWDPATGQPAGPVITGHAGAVLDVCVVPGRERGQPPALASAGEDGTVRLWDPVTGQPAGPAVITGHTGPIWGICAVPGREPGQPSLLASGGEDGTVRLWDPATGQPAGPAVITGHTGTVLDVCAVPGLKPGEPAVLASAGRDGTVRVWDQATGQPAGQVITGHTGAIWSVCVVPGRTPGQPPLLASGGEDGTIRLWDQVARPSADSAVIAGHAGGVFGLCVVPGKPRVLASARSDGTVRLWDPATGQPAGPVITGHAGPVWSVCAVPGRAPGHPSLLASAGRDGTVRLWDPATGQPAGPVITGHAGPVWSLCVVPGRGPRHSSLLASAASDGTVRFWDPVTGQAAGPVITGHVSAVFCVCVVPGREPGQPPLLASAGKDGTVRFWDPATGRPAGPVIAGHAGPIWGVCVVPGREPGQPPLLASAGEDGRVRLWDMASGQPAGPVITGHAGPVYGVCAVPGRPSGYPPLLASAGRDGTVRLWDMASWRPAGPVITGHAGPVRGVYVVPGCEPDQHPVLASAGLDGTVRLWRVAAGRAIGEPLVRSADAVSGLAPCPAAIADCLARYGDGTVRTWTAATATARTIASPPDVSAIATLTGAGQFCLLSGDIYGQVHLSDPRTGGQPSSPLRVDHRAVLALCPLPGQPGAACAAAASGSGAVTILAVLPGGQLETGPVLHGPAHPIQALCMITYPAGRMLLAAAGNDAAIWIWDITAIDATSQEGSPTLVPVRSPLTGHDGRIWSLTAVPARLGQSPCLASAGADHTVRLWDPASGRSLGQPLTGHTGQVRAVITAITKDGRVILVSGGHDGTVRLWDPGTGTQYAVVALGPPVHALLQQHPDPASLERTAGGATITVGLRTGVLALDLHRDLF